MLALIKKHKILTGLCGILTALFIFTLILQTINYNKVILGVNAAGQNFSGLTFQESQAKLNGLIESIKNQEIKIEYGKYAWRVLPKDLGIDFDAQQTLQNIKNTGHSQNILADSLVQIKLFFKPETLPLIYNYGEEKFSSFAKKSLSSFENPPQNASYKFDQNLNDFVFVPSSDGQIFDMSDFKRQIDEKLSSGNKNKIALKLISAEAILTEDKNNLAKSQAKKILSHAPYLLKYNGNSWPIEKETLLEWLEFIPATGKNGQAMEASLSSTEVKDFLLGLAPAINKEPIDGKLTTKDGKVIEFSLSQNGTELKIDESAKKINQEILATLSVAQTELSSVAGKKEIQLVVAEKPPMVSTNTIDTLGLTNLIGVGTSNFSGSPKNRIHNIGIGASKISGIIIDPGQEFSIVQALGNIDASTGYLPELVIKNNRTIPEYGGGLCQVSTTLFRAAIYAGLKITERYPHAFPVHYYNPQGFDATIYPPHPDLRFINDTPNHILIQSKIEGTKITFEIYGTKDNREVKVIGPTILSSNPDGSMKTVLYQEIWRDGVLERKDTFRSNYKSPALYPTVKNPLE